MSQPGWYPDPAGVPGRHRYWDGARWSDQTTSDPTAPPPRTLLDAGAPGGPGSSGRGRGPVLLLVAGLVVLTLVVVMIVRSLSGDGPGVPEDTNTSTPTISPWDETSTPTPTPTPSQPSDDGGDVTACPPFTDPRAQTGERNGRFHGGGLSYTSLSGWEASQGWGADWLTDRDGQRRNVTRTWLAMVVVGQVQRSDFPSQAAAPGQLIECLASSYYYRTRATVTITSNGPVTIDGAKGFKQVADVRPRTREDGVVGDVVTVLALDTGRKGVWSVYVSEAPIGDTGLNNAVADALSSLKVER